MDIIEAKQDTLTNYTIPEFSTELIEDLTNEEHIIYNKNFKEETYLKEALFYMDYTTINNKTVKLTMYGYKPEGYKFLHNLGNLYIAYNSPFYLIGIEPFKAPDFHKLANIVYYEPDDLIVENGF